MNTNDADITLGELAMAIDNRSYEIDPSHKLGYMFFAVEFGGEAGESLNKVKKIERERLEIAGSRTTKEEVGDEIADTIITGFNLAREMGIPLAQHIIDVFNRTSNKRGLKTKL